MKHAKEYADEFFSLAAKYRTKAQLAKLIHEALEERVEYYESEIKYLEEMHYDRS